MMKNERVYMTRSTRRELVERARDYRPIDGMIMELFDEGDEQWLTIFGLRIELEMPKEPNEHGNVVVPKIGLFGREDK